MYDEVIERAGQRYGLPIALIRAVIEQESDWDTLAVRYEPGFVSAYLAGKKWPVFAPFVTQATEIWQRGASWGLMQVMGQVARERGHVGPFLSNLCQPEIGIEYGCAHLAHFHKRFFAEYGWLGVIGSYNAGNPTAGNVQYITEVVARIPGGVEGLSGNPSGGQASPTVASSLIAPDAG